MYNPGSMEPEGILNGATTRLRSTQANSANPSRDFQKLLLFSVAGAPLLMRALLSTGTSKVKAGR